MWGYSSYESNIQILPTIWPKKKKIEIMKNTKKISPNFLLYRSAPKRGNISLWSTY